jgi:hypothetical protein
MIMKSEETLLYAEKGRLFLWSFSIKVYQDRIEAYFTPHRQVIPLSDIESVEIVEKIPWTVGRGLRYGIPRTKHSGTKYFVIRGEGIILGLKRGRWKKIVLSVKEPEKVKALIEERLEQLESEIGLTEMVQTV